jgi:hypothetical protein
MLQLVYRLLKIILIIPYFILYCSILKIIRSISYVWLKGFLNYSFFIFIFKPIPAPAPIKPEIKNIIIRKQSLNQRL